MTPPSMLPPLSFGEGPRRHILGLIVVLGVMLAGLGAYALLNALIGSATGLPPQPVSAVPDVPSSQTPTGGWKVQFADGFGLPLGAGSGYDNAFFPNKSPALGCVTQAGHNSNEMQNFTCAQANVTSAGLDLKCSYGAPAGAIRTGVAINYNCGEANSGNRMPAGYAGINWRDPYGSGQSMVWQIVTQFPPNYDSDPGFWGYPLPGQSGVEVDMFEGFGWGETGNGTDCINGNACAQAWTKQQIVAPAVVGAGGDDINGATSLGFNPAAAVHTYSIVFNANNSIQLYVDGKSVSYTYPIPGVTFTPSSRSVGKEDFKLSYGMRGGFNGIADPVPTFNQPGQSHDWIIRSVAMYTSRGYTGASATGGGSIPLIAPGTVIR